MTGRPGDAILPPCIPVRERGERMIRIVVCDDHGVVRAGLEQLIGDLRGHRGRRVGLAAARRRRPPMSEHEPDVLLMDLEMPGTRRRRDHAAHPSGGRPGWRW